MSESGGENQEVMSESGGESHGPMSGSGGVSEGAMSGSGGVREGAMFGSGGVSEGVMSGSGEETTSQSGEAPRLSNVLRNKLLYEMSLKTIIEEVVSTLKNVKCREELLMAVFFSAESDNDNSDDDMLVFLLLQSVLGLNAQDETEMAAKLSSTMDQIMASPLEVLLPYQQSSVTINGSNRVTLENFREKFRGLFSAYFRFKEENILQLMEALQLPNEVEFYGYRSTGIECLLLTLHRLASHTRLVDAVLLFDLLPQMMSALFNGTVIFIYEKWGDNLRSLNQTWMSSRETLDHFAEAIHGRVPMDSCVAFLDGTHVPVARPGRGQRSWYCGHHKTHCFKCLILQLPNGIIVPYGPFDGNVHDSTAAESISLDNHFTRHFTFDDAVFKVYADPGFAVGTAIVTPFPSRANRSADERRWNQQMSGGRIGVEWGIGLVKELFKRMTYKNNLRVGMPPWLFIGSAASTSPISTPVSTATR